MRDEGVTIFLIFVMFFLGIFIGCMLYEGLSSQPERAEFKAKAVQYGAAQWKIDQKTGRIEFVWKGEHE